MVAVRFVDWCREAISTVRYDHEYARSLYDRYTESIRELNMITTDSDC